MQRSLEGHELRFLERSSVSATYPALMAQTSRRNDGGGGQTENKRESGRTNLKIKVQGQARSQIGFKVIRATTKWRSWKFWQERT